MKLIDFIRTGPCEVSKEKFDATVANLNSLKSRMDLVEFKQVRLGDRFDAHLERLEAVEVKFFRLHDLITKLELNVQAAIRDMCKLQNELSLRIEQVSHRLEALVIRLDRDKGKIPRSDLDETDL